MHLASEAAYTCPACFQRNFVTIDPSGGRRQRFVEDCPLCCRPIEFVVTLDPAGAGSVQSAELAS